MNIINTAVIKCIFHMVCRVKKPDKYNFKHVQYTDTIKRIHNRLAVINQWDWRQLRHTLISGYLRVSGTETEHQSVIVSIHSHSIYGSTHTVLKYSADL